VFRKKCEDQLKGVIVQLEIIPPQRFQCSIDLVEGHVGLGGDGVGYVSDIWGNAGKGQSPESQSFDEGSDRLFHVCLLFLEMGQYYIHTIGQGRMQ
jgi:hypothetical protein